jgi:2-aminoethylphosphonate-pyruvate transaminase
MPRDPADPLLLTPGPVSTSATTKQVMLRDRASGGVEFHGDIDFARNYLVQLVHGGGIYTAVPLPGSATYANEAVIAGLVPQGGKLLIFSNGVYGDRLIEIAAHLRKPHVVLRTPPFSPPTEAAFDAAFAADPAITHLFVVHCETSTGVLNPVDAAAAACRRHGKGLLIDAVASFGAIELDARTLRFDALTISSNKCMEGVPGVGWTVVHKQVLESAKGVAASLTLRSVGPEPAHGPHPRLPLHPAHPGRGGLRPGLPRARSGRRHAGTAGALPA